MFAVMLLSYIVGICPSIRLNSQVDYSEPNILLGWAYGLQVGRWCGIQEPGTWRDQDTETVHQRHDQKRFPPQIFAEVHEVS